MAQCWNRGCHHANFSRGTLAARFLALALRLLDGCPELQDRKARVLAPLLVLTFTLTLALTHQHSAQVH